MSKSYIVAALVLLAVGALTSIATAQPLQRECHRIQFRATNIPSVANASGGPENVISANVIQDGGFESGTPNAFWSESSTNFGTPICNLACSPYAYAGNWYAWFGGVGDYEEAALSQTVNIAAASTASLSFQMWVATCNDPNDYLEVTVDGNQEYLVTGTDAACGGSGYALVVVNLDAYADGGNHIVRFHFINLGTNDFGSNVWVDDVALDVEPMMVGVEAHSWSSVRTLYR